MSNKSRKSATIAKTFKKNAKALLSGNKDVKRLAAALPLTAILVEEVRAAQKADFSSLAKPKAFSLDASAVPVADDVQDLVAEQDVAIDVAQEGQVIDALVGDLAVQLPQDDLVLAKADLASEGYPSMNGTVIADAGPAAGAEAGAAGGGAAAGAGAGFELSALPAVAGAVAGPLGGAIAGIAAVVASNKTTTPNTDYTAKGAALDLSLKQLQAQGMTNVTMASGVTSLSVDLGTEDALSAVRFPTFGDTDKNGVISAAEDAAIDVTLNASSLSQIHELPSFSSQMQASGIDHVALNLNSQAAFDDVLSDATFATSFDSLITAGLDVSIDMATNLANLNVAQAGNLVAEGLHFASNDYVQMQLQGAEGTHLSTSLKDLQKLGVDAMSVVSGGDAHVGIDLGNFSSFDAASFSGLPVFKTALDVTLGVNSVDQLHGISSAAVEKALISSHIDHVQLNVADQAAFNSVWSSAANTSALNSDLTSLRGAGLDVSTIDVGGHFMNSQIHLSQLQAATLNAEGLHFAANDFVSMDVTAAQGTHLTTSMADLHKLGVDTLTITDGEHITDLGLMANSLTSHGITHLGLSSSDIDNTTITAGSTLAHKVDTFDWAHSGIDLALDVDSNVSNFMHDLENGIDVFNGQQLSATAKWGDLIGALHQSGLGSINLQSTATTSAASANVVVSDELTGALYDAGMLHALPDANITLDVGTNKVLQTSLKAMLDLGVDKVQTDHKVYVGLGLDQASAADMQGVFASFNYDTTVPADGLFGGKAAGLVVDQATFNTMGASDVHTLVQQLSKLGITEIDVLSNANVVTHAYQITAQTQVLSQVDILGTSSASTDLAVFDTDILHKTIKA
ncbi:hypothetical protein [Limnohabitans sp.]|uniref:hypothetical protein n=1 Tax=Limnohabitans sp. TaxID=1907725 RepID=UPI00286FAD17|nr:hypothetical protein [Limnohabitans sp.]